MGTGIFSGAASSSIPMRLSALRTLSRNWSA